MPQAYYKVSDEKTMIQVYLDQNEKVCIRLVSNYKAIETVRTALRMVFALCEEQPADHVLLDSTIVVEVEAWLNNNFKFSE